MNGGDRPPELPLLRPQEFAALVSEATDDQLEEGLEANGELIVGEIFRRIPEQFDPRRADGVEAVVEWRIKRVAAAGEHAWQLVLHGGRCEVAEGRAQSPTVTYEIGEVDFIRLVAGDASGPKLFLYGRLKVRGNLILAARMPSFFAIPGASD